MTELQKARLDHQLRLAELKAQKLQKEIEAQEVRALRTKQKAEIEIAAAQRKVEKENKKEAQAKARTQYVDDAAQQFFIDSSNGDIMYEGEKGLVSVSLMNALNLYRTTIKNQYAEFPIERIHQVQIIYDPRKPHGFVGNPPQFYNKHQTTELFKTALMEAHAPSKNLQTIDQVISHMPTLWLVINNILPDERQREYFLNFLAATIQGNKLNTGIVLTDAGGTGKSLLLEYAMSAILGETNFQLVVKNQLHDQFQGWIEHKQLIFGEEINQNKDDRDSVSNFLKQFITGERIMIRKMRQDYYSTKNETANMILASNNKHPIYLKDEDRRWNVFGEGRSSTPVNTHPYWKENIKTTQDGKDAAKREALYLAIYLLRLSPDFAMLTQVYDTPGRNEIIIGQKSGISEFAERLYKRDITWFKDNINATIQGSLHSNNKIDPVTLNQFYESVEKGKVPNPILFLIWNIVFKDRPMNSHVFCRALREEGLAEVHIKGNLVWDLHQKMVKTRPAI